VPLVFVGALNSCRQVTRLAGRCLLLTAYLRGGLSAGRVLVVALSAVCAGWAKCDPLALLASSLPAESL
jgi:hypothetical protein